MNSRILLVEDDAGTVLALTLRLQSSGYTVLPAIDGATAIRIAGSALPDLIVLDLGKWFLASLKEHSLPECPKPCLTLKCGRVIPPKFAVHLTLVSPVRTLTHPKGRTM
jgi:DNA-binding NarL/FixJ family response regulator